MQAVILAAGMGKRLKELTQDNTKCMVSVNGVTLIDRMLHQIDKYSFSRIVIVIGYQGDKLINYIGSLDIQTPIVYIENSVYDKTNNIYSLSLAKDWLCEDDTILFESDLIFEDAVLDSLISDPRETLALVDKYESWMDGTCVKLTDDDRIIAFVPGNQFDYDERDRYYKTVNIYKFSKHFSCTHYVPFLIAYQTVLGNNEYYEQVLRVITMLDNPGIRAKRLEGQLWYEIDDIQDLDIASSMFVQDEDLRVDMLSSRYGGYWRYPHLTDFCYLVNPFFPPEKMLAEMKASFEKLLIQYPSGMAVNSLLAAKNFGIHIENIVVGNGAAELIKVLMDSIDGKVGIIRPTFEEYAHRCSEDKIEAFWPTNDNFEYSVNDIINYFSNRSISSLIVINPDNPSGNYICKSELLKLVTWTKQNSIRLIIDESFIDFSDELGATLFDQQILDDNKHLFVIKSISKSYGVPGLRLGILASGDEETVNLIKSEVSIWNINSFAEFFMQIIEKYKTDYEKALELFRAEREWMYTSLAQINGIRVIPSQANFFMVEICNGITAKELCRRLIVKHNLIVKNLVAKMHEDGRQYLRLAIRNRIDDEQLVLALKEELYDESN